MISLLFSLFLLAYEYSSADVGLGGSSFKVPFNNDIREDFPEFGSPRKMTVRSNGLTEELIK